MQGKNDILGGGGIHHVGLQTNKFDETYKFYTEILGFKEAALWQKDGKRAVTLDTGDGNCFEIFETDLEFPKGKTAIKHIALRTSRCIEVLERVRAAGMEIIMEPTDIVINSAVPIPARIAFFKGPDGEEIELFQNK
jgi:catechol 2,3-dioxygenase-like lactoylglutathione lyase family enzyme